MTNIVTDLLDIRFAVFLIHFKWWHVQIGTSENCQKISKPKEVPEMLSFMGHIDESCTAGFLFCYLGIIQQYFQ